MIFADDQSTFSLGPNALLVSKGLRKSMIFADRPIKRTTYEKDFVPKKSRGARRWTIVVGHFCWQTFVVEKISPAYENLCVFQVVRIMDSHTCMHFDTLSIG